MNKIYVGARLIHPDGDIENSYLWVKEGKINGFGEVNSLQPPSHGELLDYSGRTITADFKINNGLQVIIQRESESTNHFSLKKNEE